LHSDATAFPSHRATTSLVNATAKKSYTATLLVTPGTGIAPFKWSLISGSKLPAGLTLNPTKGIISGKPKNATAAGAPASFTVEATDAKKQTAPRTLTLTIGN